MDSDTCPVCKLKVTSILHSATSPVGCQELTISRNSETGKLCLCQGVILEMFNLMERNYLTWQSMMVWLRYYYGANFREFCPSVQAITSRVKCFHKKVRKLSKDGKKIDIEAMKSIPFDLPDSKRSESFQ